MALVFVVLLLAGMVIAIHQLLLVVRGKEFLYPDEICALQAYYQALYGTKLVPRLKAKVVPVAGFRPSIVLPQWVAERTSDWEEEFDWQAGLEISA